MSFPGSEILALLIALYLISNASHDYADQHRVVRRVTVAGDVPVGVDGRRSVSK